MRTIEIQNISKSFGANKVLENVSFSIKTGAIIGLLGPNGAGKTTLIRILNRIIKPDNGKISFNNEDEHISIGYLPEERGLYPSEKVIRQLIYFGRLKGLTTKEARSSAYSWLEKFDISDWANKKVETLSKGMAQKIQFIAAVIHDPELLILDEPFTGFDPINVDLIKKEIISFKEKGKSIIISTHNMNSVEEMCDEIILINKGKVIVEGTLSQLKKLYNNEVHSITFRGNMIAFANALWTGYELLEKKSISDELHFALIKMKNENDLTTLVKTMEGQVTIESIGKNHVTMNEIFLKAVAGPIEDKNKETE